MSARETARGRLPITLLGVAAAVLYLGMNYLMLWDVVTHVAERGAGATLVYLAWIGCGFIVFTALLIASNVNMLTAFLLLFLVSLSTNYAYVTLTRRALTFDVMEWLPWEMGQLPRAWHEFPIDIGLAVFMAFGILMLFLVVRIAVRRRVHAASLLLSRRARVVGIAAFLSFHGIAMALQPPQMMAETNLFVFGVPALFSSRPQLRPVGVTPERAPLAEKVVLVVDESVTHRAYREVVAPALKNLPLVDFGEAASVANCSAASNALLRWGVEKPRLRDPEYDPRTNPTIWAYAKAAGFRTVLIDGQSTGTLQNYLGPEEFRLIDEFVPAASGTDIDVRLAALLRERLQRPGREFIYAIKEGTHFPYASNYPRGMVPADAPRAVKYRTAVSYKTTRFFEELMQALPLSTMLLIYTSDHGQAPEGRLTHCNAEPHPEEYSVPLIAASEAPGVKALLDGASNMHDRASHLNILPTLLYTFGYARAWVEETYGRTLAGPPSPYITYANLGWNIRVKQSKRQTVDVERFVETESFPRRKAVK